MNWDTQLGGATGGLWRRLAGPAGPVMGLG